MQIIPITNYNYISAYSPKHRSISNMHQLNTIIIVLIIHVYVHKAQKPPFTE